MHPINNQIPGPVNLISLQSKLSKKDKSSFQALLNDMQPKGSNLKAQAKQVTHASTELFMAVQSIKELKKESEAVKSKLDNLLPKMNTPNTSAKGYVKHNLPPAINSIHPEPAHLVDIHHNSASKGSLTTYDVRKTTVELGAFAIHKLSYIDRFANVGQLNLGNKPMQLGRDVTENEINIPDTPELIKLVSDSQQAAPVAMIHRSYLPDDEGYITGQQSVHLTQDNKYWIEKIKVSILGDADKTLVIRDYISTQLPDRAAIEESLFPSDLPVSRIIINGKEI